MINNNEREKENQKKQQEAVKWLAGLMEIVAVAKDGTQRVLTGEEATDAIIRQWEADEKN